MAVRIERTRLPEVALLLPEKMVDERGHFARVFSPHDLDPAGIEFAAVESGFSLNRRKGTVRGLHWQRVPFEQAKIVGCTRGRIFDVAVDVRPGSRTFGQWVGVELDADSMVRIYIPKGFAHGFQSLEDDTEVLYEMSEPYAQGSARTIAWNDPEIGIAWPLEVTVLSSKDTAAPRIAFGLAAPQTRRK